MKKIITVHTGIPIEMDDFDGLTREACIAKIHERFDKAEADISVTNDVFINGEYDRCDGYTRYWLSYKREESDAEYERRLQAEAYEAEKRARVRQEKEYQYELLKKELGK